MRIGAPSQCASPMAAAEEAESVFDTRVCKINALPRR